MRSTILTLFLDSFTGSINTVPYALRREMVEKRMKNKIMILFVIAIVEDVMNDVVFAADSVLLT